MTKAGGGFGDIEPARVVIWLTVPVAVDARFEVFRYHHTMRRRKLMDGGKDSFAAAIKAVPGSEKKTGNPLGHDIGGDTVQRQQCLVFRREREVTIAYCIQERFLAEAITSAEKAGGGGDPRARTRTSRSSPDAILAPGAVGFEYDLGITCGGEPMAHFLQPGAQFKVIVDFTVEHDDKCTIRSRHRLTAVLAGADDRQSPMTEHDTPIGLPPLASPVRAAMCHESQHSCDRLVVDRTSISKNACDPAHGRYLGISIAARHSNRMVVDAGAKTHIAPVG